MQTSAASTGSASDTAVVAVGSICGCVASAFGPDCVGDLVPNDARPPTMKLV